VNGEASIGFLVAFLAGLLSFLSPCVLPLVPSYVGFITGMSLDDIEKSRRTALVHTLLFVLGFSLIFLALGATATLLGRFLLSQQHWISRAGGVLVILFGLVLMGVVRIKALTGEARLHISDKPVGYLGTVAVGMAFGAGWTPCLGPVLGGILTYAASTATLGRGMALLGAYSLGLALPFVLASVALGRFFVTFAWFRKYLGLVNRVAGGLLVAVGLLLVTDRFAIIAGWLRDVTPQWMLERL
jgi:cytochrome c-type biogenesis protein